MRRFLLSGAFAVAVIATASAADLPNLDGRGCGGEKELLEKCIASDGKGACGYFEGELAGCRHVEDEQKAFANDIRGLLTKDEMARCEKSVRSDKTMGGYGGLVTCIASINGQKRFVEISAAMGQKDPVPSASYCKQRNEGGVGYNIDLCLAAEQRAIDGLAGKVDLRAADDPDIARCVSEAASKLDSWAVLSSCLNRL